MFTIFWGDKWYCYLFNWQFKYLPFPCNNLCIRQQSNTSSIVEFLLHMGFSLSILSDDANNWDHCHFLHTSLFQYLVLFQVSAKVQVSTLGSQSSISDWSLSFSFVNWKINGSSFEILHCILYISQLRTAHNWDSGTLIIDKNKRKKRKENLEMNDVSSHLSQYLWEWTQIVNFNYWFCYTYPPYKF